MRHQHRDLAILDFPAAYGSLIPDLSAASLTEINQWRDARALSDITAGQVWLQMAHRFGALLIAGGVLGCCIVLRKDRASRSRLRILSTCWACLLVLQVTLGAWTIWSNKAADVATAHVAVGATMLGFGICITALAFRSRAIGNAAILAEPSRRFEPAPAL
jgi:cytochrome c oxidase assembly protein subunit 15